MKSETSCQFLARLTSRREARPRFVKFFALSCGLAVAAAGSASAANWQGTTGNWSASSTSPGWDTTYPNAIGATANFTTSGTTTQDIVGGVTVGTLSLLGNSNVSRTVSTSAANPITLNQDGVGVGTATISNANTNTGSTNALILTGGTFTLADNLLISNTGGSTNVTGAVQFGGTSVLAGTGNLTLSNVSNDTSGLTGVIRMSGTNTFTGTVNISQGLVTYNAAAAFGGVAANTITLGSAGQSASLLATTAFTTANNFAVAAGAGTVILGSTSSGASNTTFSGTGTLNSTLTLRSDNTGGGAVVLSGIISGAGGITKIGAGLARLSAANTYTGATAINAGTLQINGNQSAATGAVTVNSGGTLGGSGTLGGAVTVASGGTLAPGTASAGILTASSLTLSAGSTLAVELGGATAGTGYDQARASLATGTGIAIAGNLSLTLINGFTPMLGQTFYILDNISSTALVSGTFANAALTVTDNQGNVYAVNYAATNPADVAGVNDVSLTVLTVVPEPGTWAMVAGGAGLLVFLQQHRRKLRQRAPERTDTVGLG